MPLFRVAVAPLLIVAGLLLPGHAKAAQSYDNCANFIDSIPATISTQGVWCLRKDLTTAIASGAAIKISANNVTIDCNDFKLGGLAAGSSSQAEGIYAAGHQNTTIRNCNVRGFNMGISLLNGAGHLIENNRLDNNLRIGIRLVMSGNSVIRNNRIYDTGGFPDNEPSTGIYSYGDTGVEISDNTIAGVVGTAGYFNDVIGINRGNVNTSGVVSTASIVRNRISALLPSGAGKTARGISITEYGSASGKVFLAGNELLMASPVAGSIAIHCSHPTGSVRDSSIWGFSTALSSWCLDAGGNVVH